MPTYSKSAPYEGRLKCDFAARGRTAILGSLLVLISCAWVQAQNSETIVHIFATHAVGGIGGVDPWGGVVIDASGNLYGTTNYGGKGNEGVVYEMSRGTAGQWVEKVIYYFGETSDEGEYGPLAGLVMDRQGNLYGTTIGGGGSSDQGGSVFELSPSASGKWIEKVLYAFGNVFGDALQPRSAVTLDSAGNIYGTTVEGGAYGKGAIFKLTRGEGGVWTESVLYSFGATTGDAGQPNQPLAIDSFGNLWGTTYEMGASGLGAIYELSPGQGGSYTEKVVYSFTGGADGGYPQCGFILDALGNLYGTTGSYGANNHGTVFELSPTTGGSWTLTTLYAFDNAEGDGANGNLLFDPTGNLYGVTWQGGSAGQGNVFRLSPSADGTWTVKTVHSFLGEQQGCQPDAGVVMDSAGNLYGTTLYCGSGQGVYGSGVVYEIVASR